MMQQGSLLYKEPDQQLQMEWAVERPRADHVCTHITALKAAPQHHAQQSRYCDECTMQQQYLSTEQPDQQLLTRIYFSDHTWCLKIWRHLPNEGPWWRVADVIKVLRIV